MIREEEDMGVVLEILAVIAAVAIVGIVIGVSVLRRKTGGKNGCGGNCSCCGGGCGARKKNPGKRDDNEA